jgi:hypothetical protein
VTLAACPACGTETNLGATCRTCGTPVAESSGSAASGYAAFWESMMERLQRATAPKYRVTGILGYGGMAGVFAADEPRLGRRVAIKVMSPALMMDPKLVERFVQEARTIALLSHPNIVTIYEVDETEDLHWFAMSHIGGRTLGQVMTETADPLPVAVVRAWLYQIGDALAYAHQSGIIHRDVKPGNVLLDTRGNALVTDFGIAKVADAEAGLTRTGMLVGTPTYMSPEQCSSGQLTGASDQYALGAVVYQMLTGQPPFAGPTLAVLQAHVAQYPTPITALRPECPPEFADAVQRMLAKQPEQRFATMSEAIAAAGARPLGMSDPVRDQLAALASPTASLEIRPQPNAVREGVRTPLEVLVRDIEARATSGRRVHWASSAPAVAQVIDGALLAFSPGVARLTVMSGAVTASAELVVEPDPIHEIAVSPAILSIPQHGRAELAATVSDLDGTTLEQRAVLWSSSDPAIARVTPAGTVIGVAQGEAYIAARSGGVYATARITVTPPVAVPPVTAQPVSGAQATPAAAAAESATPTPSVTPVSPTASSAAPVAGVAKHQAAATTDPLLAGAAGRRRVLMLAVAGVLLVASIAAVALLPSRRTVEDAGPAALPVAPEPASDAAATADTDALPPSPAEAVPEPRTEPRGAASTDGPAPVTPTQQAPTAPADAPPDGTVSVPGQLPAGAVVVARAADGRLWPIGAAPVPLVPGTYTLEFRAPGYELDTERLVVQAGVPFSWSPRLRQVAPPAAPAPTRPAAPARDVRADQAAVEQAVREYAAAFDRRDRAVVPLLPQDARANWAALLGNERQVTDFSAALEGMDAVRVEDDVATVSFVLRVSFRNNNQNVRQVLRFSGSAERAGSGWRLVSLRAN